MSSIDRQALRRKIGHFPNAGSKKKQETSSIHIGQVGYPKAPQNTDGTKYITCEWCFETRENEDFEGEEWRKHVDRDMKPYICISEACSDPTCSFGSFKEWQGHMLSQHGRLWHQHVYPQATWVCAVCSDSQEGFKSQQELHCHMETTHDFTEAQLDAILRQSRIQARRRPNICPLCNFNVEDDPKKATGVNTAKAPSSGDDGKRQQEPLLPESSHKRARISTNVEKPAPHESDSAAQPGIETDKSTELDNSKSSRINAMAVHVAAHLQGLMFLTIRLMCIRDDNAEAASIASASADSGDNSTRKMASSDTQEKPDGSVASTNDMDPTSDKDGSEDEFSNNAVRKSAKVNWALDSCDFESYTNDEEVNTAIAELRLYTECFIRFRFPMAPDSLRSALVEANALRLRRLCYQLYHRIPIDLSILNPETNPNIIQNPKIEARSRGVSFASGVLPKPTTIDKISGPARSPPVPVTNATTARQTAVADLYAKSINEIPSVINNKLSFPPIPQTEECPYCGVIIEFKNRVKSAKLMLWHNHVIRHLEPFICVFAHCLETNQYGTGPMTFETSKAWISHMQNAHGHVWEHSAPSSDPIIFDQETQYQEHSIKEYGMPKTHSEALDSAARRPVLEKVLECPFGDDFQPSENFESSSSGLFSSEALQLHVVAHMKEIALLTLQKLHVDGDEDSENVHSDLASKDNGLDFAPYRESMYSLLDEESLDYRDEESLDYQDDDAAAAQITQGHGEEETSAPVRILDKEDK